MILHLEKGEEPWLLERGVRHHTHPGEDQARGVSGRNPDDLPARLESLRQWSPVLLSEKSEFAHLLLPTASRLLTILSLLHLDSETEVSYFFIKTIFLLMGSGRALLITTHSSSPVLAFS